MEDDFMEQPPPPPPPPEERETQPIDHEESKDPSLFGTQETDSTPKQQGRNNNKGTIFINLKSFQFEVNTVEKRLKMKWLSYDLKLENIFKLNPSLSDMEATLAVLEEHCRNMEFLRRDMIKNREELELQSDNVSSKRKMVNLMKEMKDITLVNRLLLLMYVKNRSITTSSSSKDNNISHVPTNTMSNIALSIHPSWLELKKEHRLLQERYSNSWPTPDVNNPRFSQDEDDLQTTQQKDVDDTIPVFQDEEEDRWILEMGKIAKKIFDRLYDFQFSRWERELSSSSSSSGKGDRYGTSSQQHQSMNKEKGNDEYEYAKVEIGGSGGGNTKNINLSTLARRLLENSRDEEVKQVFLHVMHGFLDSPSFHCPICNNCIHNVVIRHAQQLEASSSPTTWEQCLFYAKKLSNVDDAKTTTSEIREVKHRKYYFKMLWILLNSHNFHCPSCDTCISKLLIQYIQKLKSWSATHIKASASTSQLQQDPIQESSKPTTIAIDIPCAEIKTLQQSNRAESSWEILQCVVSGNLFAVITSLVTITCAATVNISIGNILAFALTNLVAGLFVIRHNIARVLRRQKLKRRPKEIKVEEVKKFKEILRDESVYLLYFTMALLSFLVLGVVPPLVYGFTFIGTGDKGLKLVATLGASLLCIILLSIFKVCLHRPQSRFAYLQTMVYYACIGVVAFSLAYAASDLFGKFT